MAEASALKLRSVISAPGFKSLLDQTEQDVNVPRNITSLNEAGGESEQQLIKTTFDRKMSMGSTDFIPQDGVPNVEFAKITSNIEGATEYLSARKSEGKSIMCTLLEQ